MVRGQTGNVGWNKSGGKGMLNEILRRVIGSTFVLCLIVTGLPAQAGEFDPDDPSGASGSPPSSEPSGSGGPPPIEFGPPTLLSVGISPVAVHVTDLDEDGQDDLISVNIASNDISIP